MLEKKKEKEKEIKKFTTRKRGRPALNVPHTFISLSLPNDMIEKIKIARFSYENNQTKYIQSVIQKDLDEHFEEYKASMVEKLGL